MDRIMTAIDSMELRLPRGTSATSETVGKARIRLNPHFVPHRSDIVSTGPQGGGLPGQMSWDTILSLLSSIVSHMHRLGFTVGCVQGGTGIKIRYPRMVGRSSRWARNFFLTTSINGLWRAPRGSTIDLWWPQMS